jgi:hypothetical protein
MAYDDIVIGSGLSGLAVAMGLDPSRRVLVLCDPDPARVRYYDDQSNVPSGVRGCGGLGNFWHGVIPFSHQVTFAQDCQEAFETLFRHFYPGVEISGEYSRGRLFVPRRPIRPRQWWPRLAAKRAGRLDIRGGTAVRFSESEAGVTVDVGEETISAHRLWICAGALDTPALLARSVGSPLGARGTASDHVICYLGQIVRDQNGQSSARVEVERTRLGYWLTPLQASPGGALLTAKPARFSYRKLDHGIEQRAAFGLPVGGVVSKVLRAGSLGLVSEAVFNKLGAFDQSKVMSIYAQIAVPEAYELELLSGQLKPIPDNIRSATDSVRNTVHVPGLIASQRPELFIRGIHLHDTLDESVLIAHNINTPSSRVRIADASVIGAIGGEHHSFHMMAKAYKAARQI